MALQHLVADFVGELKPLDQSITNLRIRGVALIPDQPLAQTILHNRIWMGYRVVPQNYRVELDAY
jgi:hypothetical protein